MDNTAKSSKSLDEMLESFSFETSNFIYKNKNIIIGLALGVVVIVAAILAYFYWQDQVTEAKNIAFYRIEKLYKQPESELSTKEKLNQINSLNDAFVKSYPNTDERNIIQFYLGKLELKLGNKKEAIARFDELIYQVKRDIPIRALASIELAHLYQSQGKADKSIQVLQGLETDLFAELKMFELAEAYLANKDKKQALNYYKIFLKDYPKSPYKEYVQQRAASIK